MQPRPSPISHDPQPTDASTTPPPAILPTHRGEVTIADLAAQVGCAQYELAQLKRRQKAGQPVAPSEILAIADELERLALAARECAADHESRCWVAGGGR